MKRKKKPKRRLKNNMFDYVSGKIAACAENRIVIDCGGVGFALTASAAAVAAVAAKQEAKVPVYLAVRDDALELYGFKDEAERRLFLKLIDVSGVGAKLAITVLSGMNTERFTAAVASCDIAAFSAIKGVGKKTAERIILELKDKVESAVDVGIVPTAVGNVNEPAVSALISLGYERKEAEQAVRNAYADGMTTEQLVYKVLRG